MNNADSGIEKYLEDHAKMIESIVNCYPREERDDLVQELNLCLLSLKTKSEEKTIIKKDDYKERRLRLCLT